MADNRICLVCQNELEENADGVVEVDNLNWHKDCLGYIPANDRYDHISHDTGHAIKKRFGNETDMSVLLGSGDEYNRFQGVEQDNER